MYCALKFPASLFFVCALRLEELSEPRTLLLGTLSLSLMGCHVRVHSHTYVHTRVHASKDSARILLIHSGL